MQNEIFTAAQIGTMKQYLLGKVARSGATVELIATYTKNQMPELTLLVDETVKEIRA